MVKLTKGTDHKILYFLNWINALKRTQRPIWVDPAVPTCNICDDSFGFSTWQHHCRKCGTAVCKKCSGTRRNLPELAYFQAVRICRNCNEDILLKEQAAK